MKSLIKKLLKQFNIGISRYDTLVGLNQFSSDMGRLFHSPEKLQELIALLPKSCSQLRQDLFVLSELNFKTGGFFVEFGATDGVELSNTYLLETGFGWQGILAEPAQAWHAALAANRNCRIETDCVWSRSGEVLEFNETVQGVYSTVSLYNSADSHTEIRKQGRTYPVNTISLLDLLAKHGAPQTIDYLSIDTEGSEYEILQAFDFNRYKFRVITCEHNYTPMRENIWRLLTAKGYVRKLAPLSAFDDWYVHLDA